MSADQLAELLTQVRDLPLADQARLLEELRQILAANGDHKTRRLLELKGLGRAVWGGVDAQAYVRRERAAWNG